MRLVNSVEMNSLDSVMDIDQPKNQEDPFLKFIDYARFALSPEPDENLDPNENGAETSTGPSWNWIASRILKTCRAYSSGVTAAILLSDISQAWSEQHRDRPPKKMPECLKQSRKKYKRRKLPNTVTIDSIYEKNFLSLNSVLEAVIVEAFVLPGTSISMLSLGDYWSSNTIDIYLHQRYCDLTRNGLLKKGREIFLTGCYLRPATKGGSAYMRLLPTEYLTILLDEAEDGDLMLIGTKFCSDPFCSISLDAAYKDVCYSLYARIEIIGPLEVHGTLQSKQITLVDNDGVKLQFLLWGDQVVLANLLSVGSMLALDRPYIASSVDRGIETSNEVCLEFGSTTQLFLVPLIQHEEQVSVALTPNQYQGSRLQSTIDPSQAPQVSQVSLPCDSHGSIDFSSYPFQSFVTDLHDKMTGVSLYGVVTNITRERSTTEAIFSLRVEDATGAIWANLEALWFENTAGASFFNLSSLPALLNSSCLHKLSSLSDLSSQTSCMQIVQVWLKMKMVHVSKRFSHAICGHFVTEQPNDVLECSFCNTSCGAEVIHTFYLKITLADESGEVSAWCTGHTGYELLQISPDEFFELPEDDQAMYPTSLEKQRFTVAIVNCKQQGCGPNDALRMLETEGISWEITGALKSE
ncbi:Nucleic acid-binding proteins superfamily [Prunus dulcis]|uniref:Nucleic acid-binding proteins superfamily n=1 Tax=Prunus dulcis TaxID=3755 RepID=A0A4Y1QMN2_PRUDU|nr:Nucleic acid-binding proteins superfamily [Prunus dulcis]